MRSAYVAELPRALDKRVIYRFNREGDSQIVLKWLKVSQLWYMCEQVNYRDLWSEVFHTEFAAREAYNAHCDYLLRQTN